MTYGGSKRFIGGSDSTLTQCSLSSLSSRLRPFGQQMSQISKCPKVTVILRYWEVSKEVSNIRVYFIPLPTDHTVAPCLLLHMPNSSSAPLLMCVNCNFDSIRVVDLPFVLCHQRSRCFAKNVISKRKIQQCDKEG